MSRFSKRDRTGIRPDDSGRILADNVERSALSSAVEPSRMRPEKEQIWNEYDTRVSCAGDRVRCHPRWLCQYGYYTRNIDTWGYETCCAAVGASDPKKAGIDEEELEEVKEWIGDTSWKPDAFDLTGLKKEFDG